MLLLLLLHCKPLRLTWPAAKTAPPEETRSTRGVLSVLSWLANGSGDGLALA